VLDKDVRGANIAAAVQAAAGRLKAGEDFAVVAKQVSDGVKASEGGDWGWIDPVRVLKPVLVEAVAALEPGDTSEPIETSDAVYFVRLEGRKAASRVPYESVQRKIEEELRARESERLYREWIDELSRDAYVQIVDIGLF
jgi:parvulin-like peptidyl-prolyl isomerase